MNKSVVTKPLFYRGTSLLGMEVIVIKEEIDALGNWSAKIKVYLPEGTFGHLWVYNRNVLVPKGELTEALYG